MIPRTMPGHRFAFIAGLHRSGTSLLFQSLREHPGISGFRHTGVPEDEGQHLQSIYQPASQLGGPGRFAFSPASHLTEQSRLANPRTREMLFSQWRPFWDLDKPCLLEKTPQNLVQTRFLQALFPTARFVILLRHPVAVACATQRWTRNSLHALLAHWLCAHELFEADRPRLEHVLVLHYEDFVAHPERTLEETYRFLGLPPHPPALQLRTDVNRKYIARWMELQRGSLSRHYADEMVRCFETRINRFGYSLERPEIGPARAAFAPAQSVGHRHQLSRTVSGICRSAAWARFALFGGYKRLKRRARRLTGTHRKRRAAVQPSDGKIPQMTEVANR